MPGLFGCWTSNTDLCPDVGVINNMARSMHHQDGLKIETKLFPCFAAGRVCLGVLQPEKQPCSNISQKIYLWLNGEILNVSELVRKYGFEDYILKKSQISIILALYEKTGWDFLKDASGIFNMALYDIEKNELFVVNDRYGLRPMYWTKINDCFAYAGEVKALLKLPRVSKTIDTAAISEWFTFGSLLQNRTWIESVQLLPPATVIKVGKEGIEQKNYWDWNSPNYKENGIEEEEAIEELHRLWRQAVARCIDGKKIGQGLSGGLDSRAVLAAVPDTVEDYHTFTFGRKGCEDVRLARQCAQTKGVRHHFFEMNAQNWLEPRGAAVWRTDGMSPILDLHAPGSALCIADLIDVTLVGHPAGPLRGGGTVFKKGDEENFIDNKANLRNGDLIGEDNRQLAIDNYKCFLTDIPHWQIHHLIQQQRRFSLSGPISLSYILEFKHPFADLDFMSFVLTLPDSLILESDLYEKFLTKSFPEFFSKIPVVAKGTPVCPEGFDKIKAFSRRLKRAGMRKAQKFGVPVNFAPLTFHDNARWLRCHPGRAVVEGLLLDEKARYQDYLKGKEVRNLVKAFLRGNDNSDLRSMNDLLTFEVFLRELEEENSIDLLSL